MLEKIWILFLTITSYNRIECLFHDSKNPYVERAVLFQNRWKLKSCRYDRVIFFGIKFVFYPYLLRIVFALGCITWTAEYQSGSITSALGFKCIMTFNWYFNQQSSLRRILASNLYQGGLLITIVKTFPIYVNKFVRYKWIDLDTCIDLRTKKLPQYILIHASLCIEDSDSTTGALAAVPTNLIQIRR